MITTQGDREMHSNISINLSKKSNSKRNYSTETRTYNNSRNTSSQSLYAQAVNWQLKNPTPRRTSNTSASTNWAATHTRTVSSTRTTATTTNTTRTTASRANYTQWADTTLSSANFI